MGLLQRALETYDNMQNLAGLYIESYSEPLAPVGHMIVKMQIEITINANGNFIKAEKKKDEKIIIPVTEESAGRTSGARAHPLCDTVEYISDLDEEKHSLYMELLGKWKKSEFTHPMVNAIYSYVCKDTVLQDLEREKCIERNENGTIKNPKDMIGWRVVGLGESSGPVYKNQDLMHLYELFYRNILLPNIDMLCFLNGKSEYIATQHLGGIVPWHGKAKIISANDEKNHFTYRGRFETRDEAVSVGYLSSQKAHNCLKWLISNDAKRIKNRAFLCWNPYVKELPQPYSPLFPQNNNHETIIEPDHYREILQKIIEGYQSKDNIRKLQNNDTVIFAAFDAATQGRLSVTYYSEQCADDYLKRLLAWDSTCCWLSKKTLVGSPSLYQITQIAYGNIKENNYTYEIDLDSKIAGEQMQRLCVCRINSAKFPKNIMLKIRNKADNLQIYKNKDTREDILYTVCAVIKKYRYDHWKEDWNMALEEDKKDRSYQFGRLLAVMEQIEKSSYDSTDTRETNAIRLQQKFVQRPLYTAEKVIEKLNAAYFPQLNRKSPGLKISYEKLIGEIMEKISQFSEDEWNKPLSETYLLGYYLQKNALFTKKLGKEKSEVESTSEVIE